MIHRQSPREVMVHYVNINPRLPFDAMMPMQWLHPLRYTIVFQVGLAFSYT